MGKTLAVFGVFVAFCISALSASLQGLWHSFYGFGSFLLFVFRYFSTRCHSLGAEDQLGEAGTVVLPYGFYSIPWGDAWCYYGASFYRASQWQPIGCSTDRSGYLEGVDCGAHALFLCLYTGDQ